MDDIINRKRKDQSDQLFEKLNKNHVNVNYTVKVCPKVPGYESDLRKERHHNQSIP